MGVGLFSWGLRIGVGVCLGWIEDVSEIDETWLGCSWFLFGWYGEEILGI